MKNSTLFFFFGNLPGCTDFHKSGSNGKKIQFEGPDQAIFLKIYLDFFFTVKAKKIKRGKIRGFFSSTAAILQLTSFKKKKRKRIRPPKHTMHLYMTLGI